MNTYTNALKYGDATEPEENRLPYNVYEALSQDEQYVKLAQTRYLVDKAEREASGEPQSCLLGALDATEDAVNVYVSEWLGEMAGELVWEYNMDPTDVREACAEYGVDR